MFGFKAEIQRLDKKVEQINRDIQQSLDRRALKEREQAGDPVILQIKQAQKMYTMVQKKKSEILARAGRLQEKRAGLDGNWSSTHSGTDRSSVEGQWRIAHEALLRQLPRLEQICWNQQQVTKMIRCALYKQ